MHRSTPCVAHSSRTGKPCKRWAILGGTVCPTHGGSIKRVQETAADRLAALVDPAITALHDLLAAENEHARLGAVKDVLDRNGFKPVDKVDLNATLTYARMTDQELEARIAELEATERRETRPVRGKAPPPVPD